MLVVHMCACFSSVNRWWTNLTSITMTTGSGDHKRPIRACSVPRCRVDRWWICCLQHTTAIWRHCKGWHLLSRICPSPTTMVARLSILPRLKDTWTVSSSLWKSAASRWRREIAGIVPRLTMRPDFIETTSCSFWANGQKTMQTVNCRMGRSLLRADYTNRSYRSS